MKYLKSKKGKQILTFIYGQLDYLYIIYITLHINKWNYETQWLRNVLIEMVKRRQLCRSAEEIRNSLDRSCVFLLQTAEFSTRWASNAHFLGTPSVPRQCTPPLRVPAPSRFDLFCSYWKVKCKWHHPPPHPTPRFPSSDGSFRAAQSHMQSTP